MHDVLWERLKATTENLKQEDLYVLRGRFERCTSEISVAQKSVNRLVADNAIPVTAHGGRQGCETSTLPHFLENGLTDGGEVVSASSAGPLYPQEYYWYPLL
jgi:hypothetical protein